MHIPSIGEIVMFQSYHKDSPLGTAKIEKEELGIFTVRIIDHYLWPKATVTKIPQNRIYKKSE